MLKDKALVDDKVLSISTAKVSYTIYLNVAAFLRGIHQSKIVSLAIFTIL